MYQSIVPQTSDIREDSDDSQSWCNITITIKEGNIMKAKPKFFEPRPPSSANIGQHPVVVLTKPDSRGRVKVATMSHSHPHNPPTQPASMYGLPIDPKKGESTISVGRPQVIHVSRLRANNPHVTMVPRHFMALKAEIRRNCPGSLPGRDQLYHL